MKEKIVMVSGCYDLLHGGHIAFFKIAAAYGTLYVIIGQDKNLLQLKGKAPYFSQEERKFIVGSIKYVHEVRIASGNGMLDFEPEMRAIKPDFFVVNTDGHTGEKKQLYNELGVKYIVLERIPEPGLPARSSSGSKKKMRFPSVVAHHGFQRQVWNGYQFAKICHRFMGGQIPGSDPVKNARLLFGAENPPDSKYISGSQDQIGLFVPGINRLYYNGGFWPEKIDNCIDPAICEWLSKVLHLVPLSPRPDGYDPLAEKFLDRSFVKELGEAGTSCWESILKMDIEGLGKAMTKTFMMWSKMLPRTVPDSVMNEMTSKYLPYYPGAITSGSGGGYVGGSGTRFWPRSRENKPKQFLSLFSDKTLIENSIDRFNNFIPAENIYVISKLLHKKEIENINLSIPLRIFFMNLAVKIHCHVSVLLHYIYSKETRKR